jgi:hypothetical protein
MASAAAMARTAMPESLGREAERVGLKKSSDTVRFLPRNVAIDDQRHREVCAEVWKV